MTSHPCDAAVETLQRDLTTAVNAAVTERYDLALLLGADVVAGKTLPAVLQPWLEQPALVLAISLEEAIEDAASWCYARDPSFTQWVGATTERLLQLKLRAGLIRRGAPAELTPGLRAQRIAQAPFDTNATQ